MHVRSRYARSSFLVSILLVFACTAVHRAASAQASGPVFSTKTPTAGLANGTFYVFVPFLNSGASAATNVYVTSATVGGISPTSPSFPTFHATMLPTQTSELELQFNGGQFAVGQHYLLTLRGTYQAGTSSFGFTLNRFVTAQQFAAGDLTILQHIESANAVRDVLNALPGIDTAQDNQSLLAFIQTRPEFAASGITDTTVWAQFTDGKLILIANGDRPDSPISGPIPLSSLAATAVSPVSALRVAQRAEIRAALQPFSTPSGPPTGLPQSSSVRLLTTLNEFYTLYSQLPTVFEHFGYASSVLPATVANLKLVGGEGVVTLASHGGAAVLPLNVYAVLTTDPVDPQIEKTPDVAGDPKTGTAPTLAWMMVRTGVMTDPLTQQSKPIDELFYGIMPQFVTTYWENQNGGFDPSSLVIIDACDSNSALGANFKTAVFNSGAGVYAGWTGPVNDAAALYATALTFDRLLGADVFCPEDGAASCADGSAAGADANPPVYAQRPFDYASVMTDLALHAVQIAPTVINPPECPGNLCPLSFRGHALEFDANPAASTFGLLAPSIEFLIPNETVSEATPTPPTLDLVGIFGATPGTVSLGGTTLSGCTWSPEKITGCSLPTGPAGAGPVIVTVDGHDSNAAALSRWSGLWAFSVAGPGSITEAVNFNLEFRADIRKYRNQIHVAPIEPGPNSSPFGINTSGNYQCGGEAVVNPNPNETDTYSLNDSGTLLVLTPSVITNAITGAVAVEDSADMALGPVVNAMCQGNIHSHVVDPVTGVTQDFDTPSGTLVDDPPDFYFLGGVPMKVDVHGNIAAGNPTGTNPHWIFPMGSATGTAAWGKMAPTGSSAPDPKSPR